MNLAANNLAHFPVSVRLFGKTCEVEMYFSIFEFPIAEDELYNLAQMIKKRDIFTAGFDTAAVDQFDPKTYLIQKEVHNTTTILIADRNLMTRWINIDKNCILTSEQRFAAATLAFCQCCGILIEPNISFYEIAALSGNEIANHEEALFRIADNTSPRFWTDLAFGKPASELKFVDDLINDDSFIDYKLPLKNWNRCYILALEIAYLSLKNGPKIELINKLFEWMHSDFLFLGPGTIMALHYFAPNSPKKGILKKLFSSDRKLAIAGIKNAAWDLTLIYEWYQKVHQQAEMNHLTLLGSLDKKLHMVARKLIAFGDSVELERKNNLEMLQNLWGKTDGLYLFNRLKDYYHDLENSSRRINTAFDYSYIEQLIKEGENRISDWIPE